VGREGREELKLQKKEHATSFLGKDEMLTKHWSSLFELIKKVLYLLNIVVILVALLCVVVISEK
jgi:hypothetical protein